GVGSPFTLTGSTASFTPSDNGSYGVSLAVSDKPGGVVTSLPAAGLVSSWRGEGDAADALGVNNGTLVGGVTFAPGKVGQAFNFNGTNRVEVADAPTLDPTTAVTAEAWVNPSTLAFASGYGAVLAKGSGASRNYALFVKSTGSLRLSYFTTGGADVVLETAAGVVPAGVFSHVAAVIDVAGNVMRIYRNGQLVASRATAGPLVANASPLTIGMTNGTHGFQGLIDEPAVYHRALTQAEVQSIVNVGGVGKFPSVAVINMAPTPLLDDGFDTVLATQRVNYTATATDMSPVDRVAGFDYGINWGDGTAVQNIPRFEYNGFGEFVQHVFTTAGSRTVSLTATDKDGGAGTRARTITVLAVTSANLQSVINQQGSLTIFQVTTNTQAQAVVAAVNGLAAQATPVNVTLVLGSGTYSGITPSPKAGITLKIVGSGGTTAVDGASPSLDVGGEGSVIVSDLTLENATDAPTVQVSGGNLTLRNVVVEESSAADQSAVLVTGGTVDLGTAADPGGNRFKARGAGALIRNAGGNPVSALGNAFEDDGGDITSPYRVKDKIFDRLDAGGGSGGLVSFVEGQVFVTAQSGSIQRGIDAVATGGTVNVEAGPYVSFVAGDKLLTVAFEGGPVLTQQADALDPGARTLVVRGTAGNDAVVFNPGGSTGGTVQVLVNAVAPGTFSPTGRLIVHGGDGDDDIQVAGGIAVPAWLYGEAGNDRLKGGDSASVLLGGAGDDQLTGGQGRDLLIGGLGADALKGNGDDDLLIAGTTAFDDDELALAPILAEWTSERDYATRVANLRGEGSGPRANGDYFLVASGPAGTVSDDDAADVLQGASGTDWFFFDPLLDTLSGDHAGEESN
ncbi:MAG TPA: LamG-like jellyroll fold domain-containing protein, partial [Gemmataceae bacterium]|nr:LamG-like jellyroll fold domain-containing protein [Gemmataceae bacterium]